MAGKIKGIIVEIGGDTTGLNKALKIANDGTKSLQSELKQVNAALKFDPQNVDLLAQKQKLLTQAIDETKDKVNALKLAKDKADAEMASGGNVSESQYRKLEREISFAETALKNLETQANQSKTSLQNISDTVGKFGTGAENLGKKLLPISGLAAGAVVGIAKLGVSAGQSADDINTLAKQTGLSTEQIQKFTYASDVIDVSLETFTGSLSKLIKNMQGAENGSKNTIKAFEDLGVSYTDNVTGELRDSQDVFNECIDALARMENETQRDATAMQIFGKSARELNPLILGGSDALKQLGDDAEKAGLILSQEALDGANEFNDALDILKATAKGSFAKIGTEIAKMLVPQIKKLSDKIKDILGWLARLDEKTLKIIITTTAIVALIAPLLIGIGKIATGIQTLMTLTGALWTLITAHPIGALITALALVTVGILAYSTATADTSTEIDGLVAKNAELAESTKALHEEIANEKTLREDNKEAIENQMGASKILADELYKLADKEELSNGEKARMAALVDELNETIPELNLALNNETGELSLQKDEVDGLIESQEKLLKAKAAQEDMVIIAKQQYEAEKKQTKYLEQNNEIIKKRTEYQKEYDTLVAKAKQNGGSSESDLMRGNDLLNLMDTLQAELATNGDLFMTNQTELSNLGIEFQNASNYVSENATVTAQCSENTWLLAERSRMLSGAIPFNNEAFAELNRRIEENETASDNSTAATERLVIGNHDLTAVLEATGLEAEEVTTKFNTYADMTQNAFDRIKQNAALTTQQMTDNLKANTKTVEEWSNNLVLLSEKGIDNGLLKKLREAGPEAAGTIKNLTDAAPAQLEALNTAFQKGGEVAVDALLGEFGMARVADSGTQVATDIATKMEESTAPADAAKKLVFTTKKAINENITLCEFDTAGLKITDSITAGLNSGAQSVIDAVASIISRANAAANSEISINTSNGEVKQNSKSKNSSGKIPMFAKGGTLTRGLAIVGEAGPELLQVMNGRTIVKPLSNGEKLNPIQSGGQPSQSSNHDILQALNTLTQAVNRGHVLQADGYTLAKVVREANASNNMLLGV